jgi:hypothetical protein
MAPQTNPATDQPTQSPLLLINGNPTTEEIAALVAVLHTTTTPTTPPTPPPPAPQWAAHHRKIRTPLTPGPNGWRSNALPH